MASKVFENLKVDQENDIKQKSKDFLGALIQADQYVGELYSLGYENALIQIHDWHRQKVGGIPGLSFLIATRIKPGDAIDYSLEDSSIILLRVMDAASLPNASESVRIRVEAAQRASGEENHWDEVKLMDGQTANLLSFAGINCRVIGTFFLEAASDKPAEIQLRFGGDISNYYPNKGLKVYKPNAEALREIVNYSDPVNIQDHFEKYGSTKKVKLGQIRYASTNRKYQQIDNVPIYIHPADLLSQKSALFGMTRTGKSNTTKIISKAIFELRNPVAKEDKSLRIGQIIFDPNGEYANENVQDNNNALKNIWTLNCPASDEAAKKKHKESEVVTYGISRHRDDPDRKLMLLNFYADDNLQIGKEVIDGLFTEEDPIYLKNFKQVVFESPDPNDRSALTRFRRRVLAYRAILYRAGFPVPPRTVPNITGLFNPELIDALNNFSGDNEDLYHSAARIFSSTAPLQWGPLADAFESLDRFIRSGNVTGYDRFENWYVNQRPRPSGRRWADEDFKKIIGILQYANGVRRIGKAINQHTPSVDTDYAIDIYSDLKKGKLVIIDQSSGDPQLNEMSARRIMRVIFDGNKKLFTEGEIPPDIMVFVEEAHNLLPPDKEKDYKDIWVRVAKEGAKLRLGMVYATQEVSSIQKNILKNTANWFIAHLNNTDETKELCKYYDFADFEPSIRRAQDKGFLRIKTLSNPFVIPAQIDKFEVK